MKVKKTHLSYLALFMITTIIVTILGCTMAKISGRGALPLILNQPQAKIEVIERFEHKKHIRFDYTSAFDVSEVLSEVLIGTDADAVINLTISLQTTGSDFLVNLLTLGIANSKTFVISGELIKAPEGLGSINIPGSKTIAESNNLNDLLPLMLQESQKNNFSNSIVYFQREDGKKLYKIIRYNSTISNR